MATYTPEYSGVIDAEELPDLWQRIPVATIRPLHLSRRPHEGLTWMGDLVALASAGKVLRRKLVVGRDLAEDGAQAAGWARIDDHDRGVFVRRHARLGGWLARLS